jgi:hypothetical protein
MKSYIHKEIGQEINSISGYLTLLEEIRLNHQGRDLLCIIQVGVVDNACCGSGGCLFVEVPGYLLGDTEKDGNGQRVSRVMPVEDEEEKKAITAALNKIYPYSQIYYC